MDPDERREFLSHVKNAGDNELFFALDDLEDVMLPEFIDEAKLERTHEKIMMVTEELKQRGLITKVPR